MALTSILVHIMLHYLSAERGVVQETVILEPPKVRLSLGVTGHRSAHASFDQARDRIAAVLANILDQIDAVVGTAPAVFGADSLAPTRLLTLLADGTDRMAAEMALDRGYELVAPLPFGRRLNKAINALPGNADDARALLDGGDAADPATQEHADAIRRLTDHAHVFSLADQDDVIAALFLDRLDAPDDFIKAQRYTVESSRRVALAGRILIEQSDLLIAVWDGVTTGHVGGTGHTIATALDLGAPVVWINPAAPEDWRILRAPESLATRDLDCGRGDREDDLAAHIRAVFDPGDCDRQSCVATIGGEKWPSRSSRFSHAYRRIETLFGGKTDRSRFRSLKLNYERPDEIALGSAAEMLSVVRALPGGEAGFADRIVAGALKRFAWADGISTHLSDSYRGGMIVNFILSSLAIVGGIAYIPIVPSSQKWIFALFELLLLCAILIITFYGQKRRLHGRWFETRRVAEYLRHAPLLLVLGTARAPGRWPQGTETSWPEWYVRHALRDIGLPRMVVTPAYLREALTGLLDTHVTGQRDYHFDKAQRLTTVHRNLDRLSERLFLLAVLSVALFLALYGGSSMGLIPAYIVEGSSKYFTVLGVLFPTFGAGIAGIRYFGDFERFAAISEVTAEKLDVIDDRIALLATAPDGTLHYGDVAELAHATDEIVFAEIENWQAVFGGKQIAVPV
jgi:hypothetical protein